MANLPTLLSQDGLANDLSRAFRKPRGRNACLGSITGCPRTISSARIQFLVIVITLVTIWTPWNYGLADGAPRPNLQWLAHNQGNLQIEVDNCGNFGQEDPHDNLRDPITGERLVRGMIYPRNSGLVAGRDISLWVGAIKGSDTIVATARPCSEEPPAGGEFAPDNYPLGAFSFHSLLITGSHYDPSASSDLDLVAEYTDTVRRAGLMGASYVPLGIKVHQRSMAWSTRPINDFVLVEYELENISNELFRQVYVGVNSGTHFAYYDEWNPARPDNYTGFLEDYPSPEGCGFLDTIGIAYGMDNDGDPAGDVWDYRSCTAAAGICMLSPLSDSHNFNFNWVSQYNDGLSDTLVEPRRRGTSEEPFRRSGSGWEFFATDANRYYLLAHKEFDYDQMFSAVDHSAQGWLPPTVLSRAISRGGFNWFMISSGGVDLPPGAKASFTIAIVGGENVIAGPTDYANRFYPDDPSIYYSGLDFSDLALNTRWAKWVYDNPGIDTDGDGYFGKFRVCDGDTQWYEGDGVADFRADVPPPSPKLKVIPSLGKLAIRWNGYYSENAIDPFTKIKDFEGYRVYAGLDDRESSMSLLISWDYENFNRSEVVRQPNGTYAWVNKDLPFTLDSLRVLYGDGFSPLLYTKDNPWHWNDTLFSFTQVDYNMSLFSPTGVHKVYPEARWLGTDTLQWTPDDLTSEHGEPLPKYYEYEYVFNNVLPTIAQYISVTAFDFGFAKGNIPAKESNKLSNRIIAYAQTSADSVETKDLNVYVYPNPYLFNVNYAAQGYENHDNSQIRDRSHRLNFGNLPPKCRISIYSLDGDLIRSWEHDYNPSDPQAMHDSWDLITRNTMLPAAGLYYWTVESPTRTQIGKFVIIE